MVLFFNYKKGLLMRYGLRLLFLLSLSHLVFCCEKLEDQIRVCPHQSRLPYNSLALDQEKIKAYYAIVLHNCTSDEATYLSAKGTTQPDLMSTHIEDCWEKYKKSEDKNVVVKSAVTALRNMDATVIREVPYDIFYGFNSERAAFRYLQKQKRPREE